MRDDDGQVSIAKMVYADMIIFSRGAQADTCKEQRKNGKHMGFVRGCILVIGLFG